MNIDKGNTNKEKLRKYLRSVFPMPDQKAIEITEEFVHFTLPRHTLLIRENSLIRQTYFIETGYIRSYVFDKDGLEVTTNLYAAPCFVNDFIAFFKRKPTGMNFEALTDCEGWTMSLGNVEKYFHNVSEFREFGRLLILHHYDLLNERMLGMIKDTADVRYMKLLTDHPEIFQHVPLKIIASYLGITDTSLSRIRKEIAHK